MGTTFSACETIPVGAGGRESLPHLRAANAVESMDGTSLSEIALEPRPGARRALSRPATTRNLRVNWSYAIGVVVVHLLALLAFVPASPSWTLDPQPALALFVAPVLLDAAYDTSLRDLRTNWLPSYPSFPGRASSRLGGRK